MATLLESMYGFAQRSGAVCKVLAESIKVLYNMILEKWTPVDATTDVKGIVKLNSSTNSTSDTEAATPSAVKAVADRIDSKWSPVNASTSTRGIVQLNSAINSTSNEQAATPNAVKQAYDLANAAMPKSGGKFTGAIFESSIAVSGSTITVSNGAVFTKTVSAATTFTFSGALSGAAATFSLILTNGGAYTVTWPSTVKWAGGTAPTLTASGRDVLTFITPDGTTWYGVSSSIGAA